MTKFLSITLGLLFSVGALAAEEKKTQAPLVEPFAVITTLNAVKVPPPNTCWATFYEEENFTGPSMTIWGPTALLDLNEGARIGWLENFGSVELSPDARLETYEDAGFSDESETYMGLSANDTKRGWFEENVESMTLDCVQAE